MSIHSHGEHRYSYGGVVFHRLDGSRPELPMLGSADCDSYATVTCTVSGHGDRCGSPAIRRRFKHVRATWDHARATVDGYGLHAQVRHIGSGRYVAAIEERYCDVSATAVEDLLTHVLLERSGGLVLHSAAIELDGEAIAFVGPSGAGKTTVSSMSACPWFAQDRLAVAPVEGVWHAWPLAGGSTPPGSEPSVRSSLPLGGVLRIVHSPRGPAVHPTSDVEALMDVRMNCFPGDLSPADEGLRLANVEQLCHQVSVARFLSRLGTDPLPALRAWRRA